MQKTMSPENEEIIEKFASLDKVSQQIIMSNVTVLQARQEMEEADAKSVSSNG